MLYNTLNIVAVATPLPCFSPQNNQNAKRKELTNKNRYKQRIRRFPLERRTKIAETEHRRSLRVRRLVRQHQIVHWFIFRRGDECFGPGSSVDAVPAPSACVPVDVARDGAEAVVHANHDGGSVGKKWVCSDDSVEVSFVEVDISCWVDVSEVNPRAYTHVSERLTVVGTNSYMIASHMAINMLISVTLKEDIKPEPYVLSPVAPHQRAIRRMSVSPSQVVLRGP